MKITFHRKGFANNSSSSHSVIFSHDDLENYDSDTNEFGWSDFVASSKKSKMIYFMICLFDSFCACVDLERNSEMLEEDDLVDFRYKTFFSWLHKNKITDISSYTKKQLKELQDVLETGHVDHQSHFTFPSNRDPDSGLNVEFIKYWFSEISQPGFVILGGNDNGDSGHDLEAHDDPNSGQDIKELYYHFRESSPKHIMCVYDYKTKEFVISRTHDGDIMKIEAELV